MDRSFIRALGGVIHLRRREGEGRPILFIHASPGSGRALVPMVQEIAARSARPLIVADTPGNGDSDDLAPDVPDIGWYADAVLALADALGIGEFDLYGTHTGARIALEAALRGAGRVTGLLIDGLIEYDDTRRAQFLAEYAPMVVPDDYGRHLIWAFNFIRDQAVHFPHFLRDPEHRLMTRAVPDATTLHFATLDVLKALTSYHKAYRAAFAYSAGERLPLLTCPTTFWLAERELPDLRDAVEGLAALTPGAAVREVGASPLAKAEAAIEALGR